MARISGSKSQPTEKNAPRATSHVLHPTSYALRITHYIARLNLNTLISLLIFAVALYAYTYTLAPTVIEGDAALYQFTPYILGVTYPTGFPLYILLSKLWITLIPFGEIAWRMNFFSAFCSALALPLIYNATRRLLIPSANSTNSINSTNSHLVALTTVLIFATLPTFWRWSTEAKTYALSILFFSGVLYTLGRALETTGQIPTNGLLTIGQLINRRSYVAPHQDNNPTRHATNYELRATIQNFIARVPLALPTLLLGLQIAVHNNAVLLLPGYIVFVLLYFRQQLRSPKAIIGHALLLALPGLFYFYIPLRAEWLIAQYGRQTAIEHGFLADFYHSGFNGLVRYFTATEFTGGVVTNWGLVPEQFFSVYLPLLAEDFTPFGIALGIIGGLGLAITQPRRFLPLLLWYAIPIPLVIVYGQGEQSAFLLPSFLIFAIFAGTTILLIPQLLTKLLRVQRFTPHVLRFTPYLLFLAILFFLLQPQLDHNLIWLTRKWNRDIYHEWSDALNHPLEANAGLLAHWGDLTSFWYLQHAEQRRPDLRGVYPPTEEVVLDWYAHGNPDLYIAGPLQGWASGIQDRYQLIPWGRLVRIAPRQVDPVDLLPDLPAIDNAVFSDNLRLLGVDAPAQATSGQLFPVTLTWQTLVELPPRTTVSLRLVRHDGIVAQLDDSLRSGWFPTDTIAAGQHVLSYALIPVPIGTLPGDYRLQLVTYARVSRPWNLPDGSPVLDMKPVEIVSPNAQDVVIPAYLKQPFSHDFNGEITLAGYDYSVSRVGQGKGFGLELLWQAQKKPEDNYTLLVEALDAGGNLLRSVEVQPVGGEAPTGSWVSGQFIRDQVNIVVPASAPPGDNALYVRLSWLRPDGSQLNLRRWHLPVGSSLALDSLNIVEKEDRVFAPPSQLTTPLAVNLDNKTQLLGYNTTLPALSNADAAFQLNLNDCREQEKGCQLSFEFYWQALSEMARPYRVFVHLVNDDGDIIAQRDKVPGRGEKQPTTGWIPGEVVADPLELTLAPDVPPGHYTLRLGMYLPTDGPRLPIVDVDNQPVGDFVNIGTIILIDE
ncbi:MAG: DUF2723 domain-containing protein [Anaerolineae bacterium]|nr:DUF2723 domain-containing protein [Anaerolineae bacterium]